MNNETRNTILAALAAALVGAVVVTWSGPVLVGLGLAVLLGMAFAGRGE